MQFYKTKFAELRSGVSICNVNNEHIEQKAFTNVCVLVIICYSLKSKYRHTYLHLLYFGCLVAIPSYATYSRTLGIHNFIIIKRNIFTLWSLKKSQLLPPSLAPPPKIFFYTTNFTNDTLLYVNFFSQ